MIAQDEFLRHKKRMCIDYFQTVNLFTELDAYPLPRIDDMINKLSQYTLFSTFDLKSAYHQINIRYSPHLISRVHIIRYLFEKLRQSSQLLRH